MYVWKNGVNIFPHMSWEQGAQSTLCALCVCGYM